MSWSELQSLFDGQGLTFWAAVAAVALGLTLLSVSIIFQVRKVVGRGLGLGVKRRLRIKLPARSRRTAPQVTLAPEGYRATGFVPSSPSAPPADPLLDNLLARLKTAAERLERIHGSLEAGMAPNRQGAETPLKEPTQEVDYIYQAGRA